MSAGRERRFFGIVWADSYQFYRHGTGSSIFAIFHSGMLGIAMASRELGSAELSFAADMDPGVAAALLPTLPTRLMDHAGEWIVVAPPQRHLNRRMHSGADRYD